jgi:hypothetical protein
MLIRVISTAHKSGITRFFPQGNSEGSATKVKRTNSNVCTAYFRGFVASEAVCTYSRLQMCWQGFLQPLLIHRENADTKHLDASLSMIDLSVTETTSLRVFTPASHWALPTEVGSRTITDAG